MARQSCSMRHVAGILLILAMFLSVAQLLIHHRNIRFAEAISFHTAGLTRGKSDVIKTSDFPWYVDRPKEPVMYGWEDEWMTAWKRKKYKQNEEAVCRLVHAKAPTDDGTVCEMPAYVPPRAPASSQQKITRVIFQSHMYRRVSMSQYVQFSAWVALNPTYEYILFDDDDIDDFICENFAPNVSQPFSRLAAGAAKADFWRVLVMMKYGGVYVDSDLIALFPLPIRAGDDVVSGVGCWSAIPEGPLGVLEHWSMAFSPHHPLPTETMRFILENLNDPTWKEDVQSTTGPAPYQKAFLYLFEKAKCKVNLCKLSQEIESWKHHCDPEAFSQVFGSINFLRELNFNYTYANKLFETSEYRQSTFAQPHYDDEPRSQQRIPSFCPMNKRGDRRNERVERWNSAIKRRAERDELRRARKEKD